MGVNSYTNRYLCKNSGLSILLHGVISLPDPTSYDKYIYFILSSETNEYKKKDKSDIDH